MNSVESLSKDFQREAVAIADRSPSKIGTRKKAIVANLAKVLFASLVLLCALEAVTRVLVVAFLPKAGPTKVFDVKLLLASKPPVDHRPSLLFLGSSYGAFGNCTDLINTRLEAHGYRMDVRNLCTMYSGNDERMFLLQKAVDSGAKPALVCCDFVPLDYSKYFLKHRAQEQADRFTLSTTGCAYSSKSISRKRFLTRALFDKCYLFTYRDFLKQFIEAVPAMISHPEQRYTKAFIEDLFNNVVIRSISLTGWVPLAYIPEPKELLKESDDAPNILCARGGTTSGPWFTLAGVKPMIDYCAQKHIPLVFIWHPMFLTESAKQKLETDRGMYFADVEKQMKSAVSNLANVYFWDMHYVDSDPAHFSNWDHLNSLGAVPHAEALAHKLLSSPYSELLPKTE